MKALVVEDDSVTRLVLVRMLTDRGYEVTACASAEEAIEAYRLAFYPLLFLDLFLPGMDGFSLCQWIRRQPDGQRHLILVGTASDRKGDLQKILDAGADDYITKPYYADALDIRLVIAHRLKIESIAECVEDELTFTKLRQIGVDLGQGFLFGKPQSTVAKRIS